VKVIIETGRCRTTEKNQGCRMDKSADKGVIRAGLSAMVNARGELGELAQPDNFLLKLADA
jgi:hypothetical protein